MYRVASSGFQATTLELRRALTDGARDLLLILLGITSLVLLIACANVASLTLARMLSRDRELALRSALGAGRGRLVRQLLTESTLLAVAGGVVGVLFALGTVDMLTRFVGRFTARTGEVSMDVSVLLFTLLVSVLTGIVFGTLPAFGTRVNVVSALKQGSNQAGDGTGRRRMQSALIVAQVAVSVVLLVGAGLLLTSFFRLQRVDAGYRSDGVLSAQVYGNFSRYGNINALRRLYMPILDRLDGQPGIVSAAITNAVPLAGAVPGTTRFEIEGRTTEDPNLRPTTDVRVASDRYFETIGIPLVAGRVFNRFDTQEGLPVAVINSAMARYWQGVESTWHSHFDQPQDMVHGGWHRGRCPAVWPCRTDGRANLHSALPVALQLRGPGAGAHGRRARTPGRHLAPDRSCRRSKSAGGSCKDA